MFVRALSLHSRFLLVILLGVIAPLAAAGFWLTRTTRASGEALLRARIEESLGDAVLTVANNWITYRTRILNMAEDPGTLAAVREGQISLDEDGPRLNALRLGWASSEGVVDRLTFRSLQGARIGILAREPKPAPAPEPIPGAALPLELTIFEPASGEALYVMQVELSMSALLPGGLWWPGVGGSILSAFGGEDHKPLLSPPMEPSLLLAQDRFAWKGEDWLVVRHGLQEPPVILTLAAPLGPFTEPFSRAARQGAIIFAAVIVLGIVLTTLLTRHLAGSLEKLAETAESVARGDLDQRVGQSGPDEIRRVGRAFDAMTMSLRDTLRRLSRQEAAAAVGEFAATLAHEVRNPLTSIRLDLERAREKPGDPRAGELVGRALAEIERLDCTVSGALRIARSGNLTLLSLDLRRPLEAAVHAAMPEFEARGAILEPLPVLNEIRVRGDPGALEQLFLNLLKNAAEALEEGGRAWLAVEVEEQNVRVSVLDDGSGIKADIIASILEPFYSTKKEGTGLGLPISLRIARAHRGELTLESGPGGGTACHVVLPLCALGEEGPSAA
ncbi:MAG: sensor histidine kinase [Longimicrobiales bacterium]